MFWRGVRAWAVMSVCHAHYPAVLAVCARAEVVVASSCRRGTRRNHASRGHVRAVDVALQVCRDTSAGCISGCIIFALRRSSMHLQVASTE